MSASSFACRRSARSCWASRAQPLGLGLAAVVARFRAGRGERRPGASGVRKPCLARSLPSREGPAPPAGTWRARGRRAPRPARRPAPAPCASGHRGLHAGEVPRIRGEIGAPARDLGVERRSRPSRAGARARRGGDRPCAPRARPAPGPSRRATGAGGATRAPRGQGREERGPPSCGLLPGVAPARDADAEMRAGAVEDLDAALVQLHVLLDDRQAQPAALDGGDRRRRRPGRTPRRPSRAPAPGCPGPRRPPRRRPRRGPCRPSP